MARWKLLKAHYIHAYRLRRGQKQTEWEHVEVDNQTGEDVRTRFQVPLYCDEGWIISTEGDEDLSDNGRIGPIIFDKDHIHPTPEMLPLNKEAREIHELWAPGWIAPLGEEALPSQGGFNDAILARFEKSIDALVSKLPTAPVPVEQSGVSREEFESLQKQLAELIAEKAEREAKPQHRRL